VLAENYAPSDELAEEIKAFVRTRLSAYAYPRRVEFVEDLPKTLTGRSAASSCASSNASVRQPPSSVTSMRVLPHLTLTARSDWARKEGLRVAVKQRTD
jgi:hypothetical protein